MKIKGTYWILDLNHKIQIWSVFVSVQNEMVIIRFSSQIWCRISLTKEEENGWYRGISTQEVEGKGRNGWESHVECNQPLLIYKIP